KGSTTWPGTGPSSCTAPPTSARPPSGSSAASAGAGDARPSAPRSPTRSLTRCAAAPRSSPTTPRNRGWRRQRSYAARRVRRAAEVEARVVAQLQHRPEPAHGAPELARGPRTELRGAGDDAPLLPVGEVVLDVERRHRARAAGANAELPRLANP